MTVSTVSTNRFFPLTTILPEYAPLFEIELEISLPDGRQSIAAALIDCGSQDNLINESYVKDNAIPFKDKPQPMILRLADGREAHQKDLTRYTPVNLEINDHHEPIALDISNITHDIILGLPWFEKHNPLVDWQTRTITFNSPYCLNNCNAKITTTKFNPFSPIESNSTPDESIIKTDLTKSERNRNHRIQRASKRAIFNDPIVPGDDRLTKHQNTQNENTSTRNKNTKRKPPAVALVGAAPFAMALKNPEAELFILSITQITETNSTTNNNSNDTTDPDLSLIPEEYHEFADVFSRKEANKLPPHRPYDHRIPLQEGTAPPFGPIYNLTAEELKTVREYIEKHLKTQFIRHSQSPCSAPILFTKKPDGTLRLCVDYRGLNKLTIKNRYSLPLIGQILDQVVNARFFTSLDMRDGYHRLRVAEGEEWKTAFRCRYELFEYQVMPFELCNAPGTFQHFTNDTFSDFLDEFLAIYLDDLLIYSRTLKEHKVHVRRVLERLREAELYVKPEKCQFHVQEVSFLGYLISEKGIRMDPAKVEAITQWPTPTSVHDIQVFLGFANFYRRFIKRFSRIILPITILLKKGVKFKWSTKAQRAFDDLKTAFTTAPILRHYDPSRDVILETDSSDRAFGAVASQRGDDGILYPIAFYSRKLNAAELNYEIYDKEMLAIVETMDRWRHYFEGSGHKTTIITDHKNLLWFTETKVYNRRQARWAEKMSRFDFVIMFRPGKLGGKPDALSRRPDYMQGNASIPSQETIFLRSDQVDTSLLDQGTNAAFFTLNEATIQSIDMDTDLIQSIKDALPNDPNIGPYLELLKDTTSPRDEDVKAYLEPFSIHDNGLILRNGLIYIPEDPKIKLQILQSRHDSRTSGHLGHEKTLELITRDYYWPRMRQFVKEYINTCDTCARNKSPRQKPHGTLHPLPIPSAPWSSVSMDYIVELPPSNGYNAVYVCVDRLTKMAHFSPTTTEITAEETANLYLQHIFKHHGLPTDIVSDRGPQFTAKFTAKLLELLDIKGNKSTAFHPQSDGQTERVNQVLEQYLRIFCDYQQENWCQLLPLAEFAYNNAQHASTKVSPFYANYGYHPRCTLRILHPNDKDLPTNPAAENLIEKLKTVHTELRKTLEIAQARYKEQYDSQVKPNPPFKVGDLVWLSRKNITTTRPTQKLDYRQLGPYKILKIVGESQLAFKLELSSHMKIHPVFHTSLLRPYRANTIPGRRQPPPPHVEIDGQIEYVVKEILDSRIRYRKLEYYIDWDGYLPSERTWEPAAHLKHAPRAIAEFHSKYPHRASLADLPRQRHSKTRRSSS
jgi:RNase H-like domain found in reverse transcriptase/Reverse transcriptase (RNA-dependent DNA polymerase)/Integrase zinc binding domain/Chromo (CHRromatin Organisation MOdifier) domain/Integrase core domain/Retroviral aspartyl protease